MNLTRRLVLAPLGKNTPHLLSSPNFSVAFEQSSSLMDMQDFRIGISAAYPAGKTRWPKMSRSELMSGVFHGERSRESATTPTACSSCAH